MGTPFVRRWAGSDVFRVLTDSSVADSSRMLDTIALANVTPAVHLREELESVGIQARLLPVILDGEVPQPVVSGSLPGAFLVYLPTARHDFYRLDLIRAVATRCRQAQFIVVADEAHSLSDLPNVTSLGWVDDMEAVWTRTGCLLRMTRHDGIPRMVLDALRRGRQVIYSWPLEGCTRANDIEGVCDAVETFSLRREPNTLGMRFARQVLGDRAIENLIDVLEACLLKDSLSKRVRSLLLVGRIAAGVRGRTVASARSPAA